MSIDLGSLPSLGGFLERGWKEGARRVCGSGSANGEGVEAEGGLSAGISCLWMEQCLVSCMPSSC